MIDVESSKPFELVDAINEPRPGSSLRVLGMFDSDDHQGQIQFKTAEVTLYLDVATVPALLAEIERLEQFVYERREIAVSHAREIARDAA